MKPKGVLFSLFILYWIAVYGVALFSSNLRNGFRQTTLSQFIPYGYSMFTPMTKTKFDVNYEFYKNGNTVKNISLQDYIDSEYDKGLIHNKTTFVKSKIYLDQVYQLDLAFQKNQYAQLSNSDQGNFEEVINKDENLKSIVQNIHIFSKLYLKENQELAADSVVISVKREPMILPFNPEYKGDFTYVLGDTVFYKTNLILSENQ